MPWTGASFRRKHNKQLSPSQAARAARVANRLLREGKSESSAIRIANALRYKGSHLGKSKKKA